MLSLCVLLIVAPVTLAATAAGQGRSMVLDIGHVGDPGIPLESVRAQSSGLKPITRQEQERLQLAPVGAKENVFAAALASPADKPAVVRVQRQEPLGDVVSPEEFVLQRPSSRRGFRPYFATAPAQTGSNTLMPLGAGLDAYPEATYQGKEVFVSVAQSADYVTNPSLPFWLTPANAPAPVYEAQFQTNAFLQSRLYDDGLRGLSAGFNFYQNLHAAASALNLWAYTMPWRYARAVSDWAVVFWDYDYSYYSLTGLPFASRNRIGPGILFRTQSDVAWQLHYAYANTNFRLDPTQNANHSLVQVQRFQYLDGTHNYVSGGYAYSRNNAALDSWSYDGHSVFVSGRRLFGSGQRSELLMMTTYGNFAFSGLDTIQPTVRRNDHTWTLTGRVARNVNNYLTLFAQYTYYNSASSVVRQDFDSNVLSGGGALLW